MCIIKTLSIVLGFCFTFGCVLFLATDNSVTGDFFQSYGIIIAITGDVIVFLPLWICGHIIDLLEQIATNTRNTEENTSSTYISDEGAIRDIRSNLNEIKTILENQNK